MVKVIVGLGNPGPQYDKTRHNAGFLFVEHLAKKSSSKWVDAAQFSGEVAECSTPLGKLILLKPMTFMNRSGVSVGKFLKYYKVFPEEMLVVHDDLELSDGVIRLKRDGGHAGHNGLRDIIAHVGSRDFYRLRIGIGRPEAGKNVADYVLSRLPVVAQFDLTVRFGEVLDNMSALIAGDLGLVNGLWTAASDSKKT